MADKTSQLLLDALGRAVAEPAGVPLWTSKAVPGLFTTNPAGKQAAERGKELGYLRVLRTESRGKNLHEVCAITEQGLAFLLGQVSPRQVLEDLVRSLEARQAQISELVTAARQAQATLDALKTAVEKVLQNLAIANAPSPVAPSLNGYETWMGALIAYLAEWQTSHPSGDCPLPDLYRKAQQASPRLTIGRFHDGLRSLHEQGRIYLHPWTGPLYDLPKPACALLAGHEIVYYASLR
jgi:hypothetical protein